MSLTAYRKARKERDALRLSCHETKERMIEKARHCREILSKPLNITNRDHPQAVEYLLYHQREWNLWGNETLEAPFLMIGNNVEWSYEEMTDLVRGYEYHCVGHECKVERGFHAYVKQYRRFIKMEAKVEGAIAKCNQAAKEFERVLGQATVTVNDLLDFELLTELRHQNYWKGDTIAFGRGLGEGDYQKVMDSSVLEGINFPRQ